MECKFKWFSKMDWTYFFNSITSKRLVVETQKHGFIIKVIVRDVTTVLVHPFIQVDLRICNQSYLINDANSA